MTKAETIQISFLYWIYSGVRSKLLSPIVSPLLFLTFIHFVSLFSEKDRIPAWCDRVLWWTSGNNSVQQMAYASCPQLKLSDHKPVHALFNVNVSYFDSFDF